MGTKNSSIECPDLMIRLALIYISKKFKCEGKKILLGDIKSTQSV